MAIQVRRRRVRRPQRRRFTVDEYYRMADTGILRDNDRVELLDGEIVEMPPIGPEHASAVGALTKLFVRRFGDVSHVRVQSPIRLSNRSEPEPDIALVRDFPGVTRPYTRSHPVAQDVYLLLEVADSSLNDDLKTKALLYAQHGILELWVLDVHGAKLIVLREPTAHGYQTRLELGRGETAPPQAFPDITISVDEILG